MAPTGRASRAAGEAAMPALIVFDGVGCSGLALRCQERMGTACTLRMHVGGIFGTDGEVRGKGGGLGFGCFVCELWSSGVLSEMMVERT